MHKGSNPINLIFRFLLELALVIDENGGSVYPRNLRSRPIQSCSWNWYQQNRKGEIPWWPTLSFVNPLPLIYKQ